MFSLSSELGSQYLPPGLEGKVRKGRKDMCEPKPLTTPSQPPPNSGFRVPVVTVGQDPEALHPSEFTTGWGWPHVLSTTIPHMYPYICVVTRDPLLPGLSLQGKWLGHTHWAQSFPFKSSFRYAELGHPFTSERSQGWDASSQTIQYLECPCGYGLAHLSSAYSTSSSAEYLRNLRDL